LHGFGFTHPRSGFIPGCRFNARFQKFVFHLKEDLRIFAVYPHEGLAPFFGHSAHFFEGKVYYAVIYAAAAPLPDRFVAFVRQ
jgi:hypothetical protein